MRVHELAKEMGIDSKTVIQILKETESIGLVKNHMSSVDEDQKGVVKLGLAAAEEPFALTFTESDLDETSFDEYVDDDTKPSLYDVVKEDVEVAPIVTQGTAGTSAFATYSDEDRLETEEEIQKGTDYVFDHGHETLKPEEIQENDLLDQKHQGHDDLKTEEASEDMVSAEKETKEKFAKLQQDAWTKLSDEDKEVEKQEVIVERPIGFWGWLKGLF